MIKNGSAKGDLYVSKQPTEGAVRSMVQDLIDDGVYKPKNSIMTIDLKPKINKNSKSKPALRVDQMESEQLQTQVYTPECTPHINARTPSQLQLLNRPQDGQK